MNKILLLMSFIGAGYAASCENLPPSLVKSLTDSGKNGAQYVLVVNKYDAQSGYYADVWAFNGKELKHAKHLKNVDVAKIVDTGAALSDVKKTAKDSLKIENPLTKEKNIKVKTKKSKASNAESKKDTGKKEVKKSSTKANKHDDVVTKKEAKKELAAAKADYKKTGEALEKAKTKKARQTAQAARARAGKALIKAENAVK